MILIYKVHILVRIRYTHHAHSTNKCFSIMGMIFTYKVHISKRIHDNNGIFQFVLQSVRTDSLRFTRTIPGMPSVLKPGRQSGATLSVRMPA